MVFICVPCALPILCCAGAVDPRALRWSGLALTILSSIAAILAIAATFDAPDWRPPNGGAPAYDPAPPLDPAARAAALPPGACRDAEHRSRAILAFAVIAAVAAALAALLGGLLFWPSPIPPLPLALGAFGLTAVAGAAALLVFILMTAASAAEDGAWSWAQAALHRQSLGHQPAVESQAGRPWPCLRQSVASAMPGYAPAVAAFAFLAVALLVGLLLACCVDGIFFGGDCGCGGPVAARGPVVHAAKVRGAVFVAPGVVVGEPVAVVVDEPERRTRTVTRTLVTHTY